MPQSFSCLHVHIIFSTKGRAPLLTPPIVERLYPFLGGLIRKRKGTLIRIGGVSEHVHLLVQQPRDQSVSELVGEIKAISSGWIKDEFPSHGDFAWQQGYAAFSVSLSAVSSVAMYIDNQVEHHRQKSFQDELREFLDRHQIVYDERHMWE